LLCVCYCIKQNTKATCADCETLPILVGNLGIDGFSIPVQNLNGGTVEENRSVWPEKKFQALKIELTYFTGSATGDAAGGASRRLLQSLEDSGAYQVTYNGDGSIKSVFVVTITNGRMDLVPVPEWGYAVDKLPSNADEALGTSIVAVLFGTVCIYLAAFYLTK
jgi:hypothetical protein